MKVITNLLDNVTKIMADDDRHIPNAHLNSICNIVKKNKCCRYIGLSTKGFFCSKKIMSLKNSIDDMVKSGQWTAIGDNCEGLGAEENNNEKKKE